MTILNVSTDFQNVKQVIVNSGDTISKITPQPQNKYTALYERVVLSNTFPLSKLLNGSRIDFVTTNPSIVNISNQTITFDGSSNSYVNAGSPDSLILNATRPIAKKFYLLGDGNYYSFNQLTNSYSRVLLANNFVIDADNVFGVPNSNIFDWEPKSPTSIFIEDPLVTEPVRTFATGAAIGLAAVGPQEQYLYAPNTDWTPKLLQHSNFSIFQKELKITNAPFLGNTVTCQINPGECGDLIGPMYLKCSLPPNLNYTPRVGVALVDKYELYFDGLLIDNYDSDWNTIYNELFLTADEILALDATVNGPDLLIPLRFFFCKKDKYLPICALKYQKVYIKIYFNEQSWFTDTTTQIEISNPSLIYDTIFLTEEEKRYYMNNPLTMEIPKYYREDPANFTQGYVNTFITANFRVNVMFWFIRNINTTYETRYQYGYLSTNHRSYSPVTTWNGNILYYQRVFDDLQIFINNRNIVSGISDDIYYLFKQPIQCDLSVPDKYIYTYGFSNMPSDETDNGYINFSNYQSKTTNIVINFRKDFTDELIEKFKLYIYYNGVTILNFNGGYGTLQSIF
jgi:hypothetical protein